MDLRIKINYHCNIYKGYKANRILLISFVLKKNSCSTPKMQTKLSDAVFHISIPHVPVSTLYGFTNSSIDHFEQFADPRNQPMNR